MKERPILFSGPMVRAILEGRKTQTRRILHLPDSAKVNRQKGTYSFYECGFSAKDEPLPKCPYGVPGDHLWVRETFQPLWVVCDVSDSDDRDYKTGAGYCVNYPATDGIVEWEDYYEGGVSAACKPSIHMPRWASRITLEITDVYVDKLQNINGYQAFAEGVDYERIDRKSGQVIESLPECGRPMQKMLRQSFAKLWNELYSERGFGWDHNPYVWVIEFKRV